jgi:transposase
LDLGVRPSGSNVELYAAIRRDARAGKSARAIQREYRVSWKTVQKALGSAWPSERKHYPDRGSKIDDYREVIDGWLRADLTAPRKQRHTAKRIFDRLREEHQAEVSYSRLRAHVSVRRGEILAESGRAPVEVFVPQSHRPAAEAEVDFGDVMIELRGQPVTCTLFSLRLSFSGRALHRVFLSAGQEAFLEGHVHAFAVLGGVPFGRIRYDNLKSAVSAVLGLSRHRVESDGFGTTT